MQPKAAPFATAEPKQERKRKATLEQKVQPSLLATAEPKQEENNAGAKSAAEGCTSCDGGAEASGKQRRSKKQKLQYYILHQSLS